MTRYNKYNIKETDSFVATDFPKMQEEVDDIIKSLKETASSNKGEIILSYLKDHSLRKKWAEDNIELTSILVDTRLSTSHIEGLFDSCRQNKPFLKNYEDYILHAVNKQVLSFT